MIHKIIDINVERIFLFLCRRIYIRSSRQHFPHRTYLMGNMLDAVNDRTIRIREDDVAVFSHDLDDQLLLAKITHFIKVF